MCWARENVLLQLDMRIPNGCDYGSDKNYHRPFCNSFEDGHFITLNLLNALTAVPINVNADSASKAGPNRIPHGV